MTESTSIMGKRKVLALFAIIACCIMFFIERNRIFFISFPLMIVAFLYLGIYIFVYFQEVRKALLTSFYQIYFMGGLLISAASISGGARMIEVGATGDANGSFWVILAFFLAGMEATALGFQSRLLANIAQKLPRQTWQLSSLITLSVSALVVALSFFILLTVGSPILMGVDRVTFWTLLAPSRLSFLPSLVIQAYFFIAFYFLVGRKNRKNPAVATFLLIAYILITVFILGQKFSAFILIASAWLMVVSGTFPNFKMKVSHTVIAALLLTSLVTLIAASYVLAGQSAEFIFARIALQAQLMWSVLADPHGLRLLPSSDWQCLLTCGWYDNGKDYITHRYLPQGLYKYYYEGGTELSGFTPALPILTLGLALAATFHLIICFSLGILQRQVSTSVERENLVASFLFYKLQLGISLVWFGALFSAIGGSIVAALLLAFYIVIFGRGHSASSSQQVEATVLTRS